MQTTTIIRGACAAQLLADSEFRTAWLALSDRCPWSTSYQLPAFIETWYRVYAEKFEPVLVIDRTQNGALRGLFCAAVSRSDGELLVAGGAQAEYQAWISEPDRGDEFAINAVLLLIREFPSQLITFRYLPPLSPLEWLRDARITSRFVLTEKPRPVLRFAGIADNALHKPNNKKRLKGLKKLGEVTFRQLIGAGELEEIIEQVAQFYDFRLGAMHGNEPFAQDPLKKLFQLELMKQPGLLHATVLKVGDRLASVHLNVCDKKHLHMNVMSYSPLLAKHSPGKFHIHLLTEMLIADGYEDLDLTPGGDPYKERFANTHDKAFLLSFHPTAASRWKAIVSARGERWTRRGLSALRIHPARARDALESVRRTRPASVWSALRRHVSSCEETRLYARRIHATRDTSDAQQIFHRNAIKDLLLYEALPGGTSRKHFLFDAMNRMEEGQQLYSCVHAGRLTCVGWIIERPSEVFTSRALPGLAMPPHHALILGLRSYGPGADLQLEQECLAAMLSDLSRADQIEGVMMAAPAGGRVIRLLEEAGFLHKGSLISRTTLGRVHRSWQMDSSPDAAAMSTRCKGSISPAAH